MDDRRLRSIISIENTTEDALPALEDAIAASGVRLDRDFGWVAIDPERHSFITRGTGDPDAFGTLVERSLVTVYPDVALG